MSELALKLIRENKELHEKDPEKAKFLDLGECGLVNKLPNTLFDCNWLEELNLGSFYLNKNKKKIRTPNGKQDNIFSKYNLSKLLIFSNLNTLYLSYNEISDIRFLEKLTNLNSLDLRYNQISDIRFLEKLTNLNSLDLSDNQISDYSFLEKLTNLNSLYLSSNKISDYSFLEKLTNLNSLDLRSNKISDICFLEKLTNLNSLDLRSNKISDIRFLEKLTNLNSLDLRSNQISDIRFLEKLTNLNSLDLRSNQISDIRFLEKLTNLNSLYLSSNQIRDIRFLEKLTNLNSLDLRYNQISDIRFLEKLTNLNSLYLRSNQISDYSFLEKLTNLNSLDLRYNQISDIRFLEKLTNLNSLYLRSNQISDYSFLEKLTNLNSLDLSSNQIRDIRFLEKLTNLNSLDLSSNQIRDIRFLEKLTNLNSLDLSSNQISDIRFLEKLTNLNSLDLRSNQISDIKLLLPLFKKGLEISLEEFDFRGKINLRDNPISNPPLEIVKQGREAVIRYFDKLEKEGKDYIYEAKLTLVGDGGSGKTSLQRKILTENAQLPSSDERTRGIEVIDWEFKDKESNNYTAHIWDFGGQDVYYPVHRFFLTDNAVYVLMASTRFSVHNFEYWIPTIYQFGGKSPIVLVQNCDNGNQKSWDDVNVFYTNPEYNLCKPFYKINLKSDVTQELKKLKNYLEQQVIQLPHIGKAVPKSWVKVREALQEKAKQTDIITYTDFEILCRTADAEAFEKAIDIEDLGKFLHDLGIILWYYDKPELRHLVILKPEWAMNAVYKIIDDELVQQQQGFIHQEDFERVWHEEKYRSKTHELKVMLQVFKIAFPKKQNKQDYILPARLLPIPEDKKWGNNEPYLRLEYHFEFMPRGIVNQVSAELSSSILSDSSVWNNAVTFKNQAGEAQMIEEYHHRKIQIKAKGRDARGILLLIMNEVVDIVKEYRGVHPTIKVPCSCKECQNLEKPTTFEYGELVSLLNKNRKEVTCNKGDVRLNVFDLLHSVGLEFKENEKLFEFKAEHLMKPVKEIPEIFFSYAWGDDDEEGESREEVVNNLYDSLRNDGLVVVRDKVDLGYQGLISEFMKNIGRGDFVIVVISDKYLKSPYCMYELYEIYRNSKLEIKDLAKKIYPIRVEKLKLDDPDFIDGYFDYWEKLEKKWENLIVKRGTRVTTAQKAEHEKIRAIASKLGDLLDVLKDMNALTKELLSEKNFERIKIAIKERIGK